MAIKFPPQKNVCGTAEAAKIYGCGENHIRGMASRGEIWCKQISSRSFVYDADEIRRLAAEREQLRKAGKLGGRRPGTSRRRKAS